MPLSPSSSPSPKSAFTLVELLAVIALIAILLIAAVVSLRGLGGASKISAAANEVKLQLDSARQYAKTYNTDVVVGIVSTNATGMATNDMLKVMASFYAQKSDSGAVTNWQIIGNPYTLPDGVYFDTSDRAGLADSTVTNFVEVASTNAIAPFSEVTYRPNHTMTQFILFTDDGALQDSLYEERVFLPLIPGRRFASGQIEGAAAQSNLAAVIEISGQTGMSIIKRVE